jgi:hypothetical protein
MTKLLRLRGLMRKVMGTVEFVMRLRIIGI